MMKDKEIQEVLNKLASNVKWLKITYAWTLLWKHTCHIELDVWNQNMWLYNAYMDWIVKFVEELENTSTVSE